MPRAPIDPHEPTDPRYRSDFERVGKAAHPVGGGPDLAPGGKASPELEPADLAQQEGFDRDWRLAQSSGKGPKGYVRSDARIHEDVCELIAARGDVDSSDVGVSVQGCEVTLDGTVGTRHEKVFLERLIEHVPGVKDVHNRLRIRIPAEWEPRMGPDGRPIPHRIR